MTDPDDPDAGPRSSARSGRPSDRGRRGEWDHLLDPRFWGLDADSFRRWGMGVGEETGAAGAAAGQGGFAALHDRLAAIEASLIAMNQRIAVLERLSVDDEAALAAEIEKLREDKGVER